MDMEQDNWFKETTGKSYQEMGQYMMEQRRIFINGLYELEKNGIIKSEDWKFIRQQTSKHFIENFPNSLPSNENN